MSGDDVDVGRLTLRAVAPPPHERPPPSARGPVVRPHAELAEHLAGLTGELLQIAQEQGAEVQLGPARPPKRRLSPSALGTECDRQAWLRVHAGAPSDDRLRYRPLVGRLLHAALEAAAPRHPEAGWLRAEQRVRISDDPEMWGVVDLVDGLAMQRGIAPGPVYVDFKTVSRKRLSRMRRSAQLPADVATQLSLYASAWEGLTRRPPSHVAAVFLPTDGDPFGRHGDQWDPSELVVISDAFRPELADRAVSRARRLTDAVPPAWLALDVAEVDPEVWLREHAPKTVTPLCGWCPFFDPERAAAGDWTRCAGGGA